MVLDGSVREIDRIGNNAADFGRGRVGNAVIDARRNLSGDCGRWFPAILDLSLPSLGLWSIVMVGMVLLLILKFGLQASAGSRGSGPGFFARATRSLGF